MIKLLLSLLFSSAYASTPAKNCLAEKSIEILPPEGFKVNTEGPWEISIIDAKASSTYRPKLAKDKATLKLTIDCSVPSTAEYKAIAYFCDFGGNNCIRKVVKGKISVP